MAPAAQREEFCTLRGGGRAREARRTDHEPGIVPLTHQGRVTCNVHGAHTASIAGGRDRGWRVRADGARHRYAQGTLQHPK